MYKLGNVYYVDFKAHKEKTRISGDLTKLYDGIAIGIVAVAIGYAPYIILSDKTYHGDLEKAVIRSERSERKE